MGKSVMKKYNAMQERLTKKNYVPKVNPLTAGWTFNTWYEKIIFVMLMCLGIWKFVEVVF
jgi:hypothetical protein